MWRWHFFVDSQATIMWAVGSVSYLLRSHMHLKTILARVTSEDQSGNMCETYRGYVLFYVRTLNGLISPVKRYLDL